MEIKEEKRDYSELANISIYDSLGGNIKFDQGIIDILEKKGIENLAQLFEAYDKKRLNCGRNTTQKRDIKALRGTVELLKYKYFGDDLIADTVLDRVSFSDPMFPDYYAVPGTKSGKNGEDVEDIIRLGFTLDEYIELDNYFDKTMNKENVSLIQLLQAFYNDETFCETYKDIIVMGYKEEEKEKAYNYYLAQTENIKNKIAIILDYYLSKNRVETNNVIEMMRAQLDSLIRIRDNLDKQINELTNQINNLSPVNKGARK